MSPSRKIDDIKPTNLSWRAALIGGSVVIAGNAISGTLIANLTLLAYGYAGRSAQDAYAVISSYTSPVAFLVYALSICAGFFGGYIAVQYGQGNPIRQAIAAGVVGSSFVLVMLLGPETPQPAWATGLLLAMPILSCLTGGYIYSRRPT
jgi:hypothetical protein